MKKKERGGISLNEDSSHYFATRAGEKLDAEKVASWVDQYAGTQVKELILNPNCMRTSYHSRVWNPIWHNYDPWGKDDQALLKNNSPEERIQARKWIHTAWQLYKDGIDVYEIWIKRSRQKNISPWLSMRMNDIHYVNNEQSYIHSEFWRNNPHFRRVSYRWAGMGLDRAFDYGRQEVREYHMKLIKELAERYDFDGLELDWMRFGFHFRPGYEEEGGKILTNFMSSVRTLLDKAEQKRGHKIKLGARIPSRPQTSLYLGMDGSTWAHRGLVDMLVITPFWQTIETDMPVEIWQQLLEGTEVILAAGLELLLRPYSHFLPPLTNSLETVRGAAISLLSRGADRIYLFNYMDSETTIDDLTNYPKLLREIGSLNTLMGKTRRHILTYADTWAPGEPQAIALPAPCQKQEWKAFRIHIGPKPNSGTVTVILGFGHNPPIEKKILELRVNEKLCSFIGPVKLAKPVPTFPLYGFSVPLSTVKPGYNLIELVARKKITVTWVEFEINV